MSEVILTFSYRSPKTGEGSLRRVKATSLQWLKKPGAEPMLLAYDVDKGDWRHFTFSGVTNAFRVEEPGEAPPEAEPEPPPF